MYASIDSEISNKHKPYNCNMSADLYIIRNTEYRIHTAYLLVKIISYLLSLSLSCHF